MQNQGTFAWFKSRTFRSSARKLNHERKGRHSRRTRPLTQLRKKEASPCSFSLPASAKFDTPGRQAPATSTRKKKKRGGELGLGDRPVGQIGGRCESSRYKAEPAFPFLCLRRRPFSSSIPSHLLPLGCCFQHYRSAHAKKPADPGAGER